jgi:hypothetical protein
MCKAAVGAPASRAARAQCKLEPRWLANVPMCGPRWAKALDAVSSLLTRASALESVLEARALTAALLAITGSWLCFCTRLTVFDTVDCHFRGSGGDVTAHARINAVEGVKRGRLRRGHEPSVKWQS